jgi:hypothetical protein
MINEHVFHLHSVYWSPIELMYKLLLNSKKKEYSSEIGGKTHGVIIINYNLAHGHLSNNITAIP